MTRSRFQKNQTTYLSSRASFPRPRTYQRGRFSVRLAACRCHGRNLHPAVLKPASLLPWRDERRRDAETQRRRGCRDPCRDTHAETHDQTTGCSAARPVWSAIVAAIRPAPSCLLALVRFRRVVDETFVSARSFAYVTPGSVRIETTPNPAIPSR